MSSNQLSDSDENSNDTNNEEIATPTAEQTRAAKRIERMAARVQNLPVPHKQKNVFSPFLNAFVPLAANDLKRWNSKVPTSPFTHICMYCDKLMAICWKSRGNHGSYMTSQPIRHFQNDMCNEEGRHAMKLHVEDMIKKKKETAAKKLINTEMTLKRASDAMIADDVNNSLKKYKVVAPPGLKAKVQAQLNTASYQDRALSAQAHWFLYSPQTPVFRNFRCGYFRKMLAMMIPQGSPQADRPALLTIDALKVYIAAEWKLFRSMLREKLDCQSKEAKGNPFTQGIHDGVTLGNKSKYQALALQFTCPKFEQNYVVAIAFVKVLQSRSEDVVTLLRKEILDLTSRELEDLVGLAVQDAAATKVARDLDLEVETCDMHDGDKIGTSAIGSLVRKDGRGGVINDFGPGRELLHKLRNQTKHFINSHTHRNRYNAILDANPDLPRTSIERDLSTTRMSSTYNLVRSTLRLKRALGIYCTLHMDSPFLSDSDWAFCVEVEAILRVSKALVTFSQTENQLIAAYAPVLRKKVHTQLKGNKLDIINVSEWQNQIHPSRTSADVDSFSSAGRECRRRALLETERRFFGNRSENIGEEINIEASLKLSQREKAVLVLDKRTCLQPGILTNDDDRKDAISALREFYVEFYVQSKCYERKNQNSISNDNEASNSNVRSNDGGDDDNPSDAEPDDNAGMIVIDQFISSAHQNSPPTERTEDEMVEIDTDAAGKEFDNVSLLWCQSKFPWRKVYSKTEIVKMGCPPGKKLNPLNHLIHADVAKMMKEVERENANRGGIFSLFIQMCKNSRCQLGALASQSFAERMNSVANLLVTDSRTHLGNDLVNKLVVLHINRDFIRTCRENKAATVVQFAKGVVDAARAEASGF